MLTPICPHDLGYQYARFNPQDGLRWPYPASLSHSLTVQYLAIRLLYAAWTKGNSGRILG